MSTVTLSTELSLPFRVWNHRLTFTPLGENRCRYTDEVEVEDGRRGAGLRLFVHVFFRYRQRRRRELARVPAASGWSAGAHT